MYPIYASWITFLEIYINIWIPAQGNNPGSVVLPMCFPLTWGPEATVCVVCSPHTDCHVNMPGTYYIGVSQHSGYPKACTSVTTLKGMGKWISLVFCEKWYNNNITNCFETVYMFYGIFVVSKACKTAESCIQYNVKTVFPSMEIPGAPT